MTDLEEAKFTVVSTMKNEGPYILDWVAHYKALGFDNLVVCSNDCEDGTDRILTFLEKRDVIRHHRTRIWPRAGIHRSALKQARRYPETHQADWIFVCDVDEYLNIRTGEGSVRDLIRASGPEPDIISVPWRMFGPNGVVGISDQPVTEQFTDAEADVRANPAAGKFVKSLFTGHDNFKRMGLHMPIAAPDLGRELRHVLPGGAAYVANGERTENLPLFDVAQVNHYALRSVDSFLIKRDRGRANHMSHTIGLEYWKKHDRGGVTDDSISRYDATKKEWRDHFMGWPRLRRIHESALEWHRQKATELRKSEDLAPLIEDVTASLNAPA